MDDAKGLLLHNKSTEGIALTSTEEAELKHWCFIRDYEEMRDFYRPTTTPDTSSEIETVKQHIYDTLTRIIEVANENNLLREQNEALKCDIAKLQSEWLERTTSSPSEAEL